MSLLGVFELGPLETVLAISLATALYFARRIEREDRRLLAGDSPIGPVRIW